MFVYLHSTEYVCVKVAGYKHPDLHRCSGSAERNARPVSRLASERGYDMCVCLAPNENENGRRSRYQDGMSRQRVPLVLALPTDAEINER